MKIFKTKEEKRIIKINKKLRETSILELNEKLIETHKQFEEAFNEIKRIQSIVVDKSVFLKTIQEIDSKLIDLEKRVYEELSNKFSEIVNDVFLKNQEYINAKNNEMLNLYSEFKKEMVVLEEKYTEVSIIKEKQTEITSNLIEYKTELEKMKELEKSYKEIAINLLNSRINSETIFDEVKDKVSKALLAAFNAELTSLKQREQKTIAEAIVEVVKKKNLIKPTIEKKEKKNFEKGEVFHSKYKKLKNCILAGVIPMLVGPAGSGKSHAIEQLSIDLGLDFYMANRIQNTFELVGFVNASGEYVTTQFYEAFSKGGLFFFDEVDASSPEALVTINAAVAQGHMAFPGHSENVEMHKNFKVVVAGNTYGSGSTLEYTGRNKLDAATTDRFMMIEWPYDEELEKKLVDDKDLLEICWALREASSIYKGIIISTRGIISVKKIIKQEKQIQTMTLEEVFKQKFFPTTSHDKLENIFHTIAMKKIDIKKNKYFQTIERLIK